MRTFMEQLTGWYEQMRSVPRPVLMRCCNSARR
jgi:hypothetical protein